MTLFLTHIGLLKFCCRTFAFGLEKILDKSRRPWSRDHKSLIDAHCTSRLSISEAPAFTSFFDLGLCIQLVLHQFIHLLSCVRCTDWLPRRASILLQHRCKHTHFLSFRNNVAIRIGQKPGVVRTHESLHFAERPPRG